MSSKSSDSGRKTTAELARELELQDDVRKRNAITKGTRLFLIGVLSWSAVFQVLLGTRFYHWFKEVVSDQFSTGLFVATLVLTLVSIVLLLILEGRLGGD